MQLVTIKIVANPPKSLLFAYQEHKNVCFNVQFGRYGGGYRNTSLFTETLAKFCYIKRSTLLPDTYLCTENVR